MEESAQASKRALVGLKSHKLNALNGMLTLDARPRNGHDGAAPPLSAKRLDVIKAYAADALPAEDASGEDASQIAQRFAPRPGSFPPADDDRVSAGAIAPPLLALASGARTLAAALIAVALLPNLVLAGLIWYGGIEPRWPSVTEAPPASQPIEASAPAVHSVLTVPIPMPSFARDAAESGDVTGALPGGAGATNEAVHPGAEAMPALDAQAAETGAPEQGQELAAVDMDAVPQDAASIAPPEPVPLPTRRPAPPSGEDADASWIKATAYVNLRAAPSRGASVVGVVARGTKLRVVARKRGWVHATDPATDKTGWVYSSNVATAR